MQNRTIVGPFDSAEVPSRLSPDLHEKTNGRPSRSSSPIPMWNSTRMRSKARFDPSPSVGTIGESQDLQGVPASRTVSFPSSAHRCGPQRSRVCTILEWRCAGPNYGPASGRTGWIYPHRVLKTSNYFASFMPFLSLVDMIPSGSNDLSHFTLRDDCACTPWRTSNVESFDSFAPHAGLCCDRPTRHKIPDSASGTSIDRSSRRFFSHGRNLYPNFACWESRRYLWFCF